MRFEDGIAAQPDALAASAQMVREALNHLAPLPEGSVVALVGIGASEHVARAAVHVWRELGIRAVAVSASELLTPTAPLADVYVALSESGQSVETVTALRSLGGARRIGVTNVPDSAITQHVEELIVIGSGPDSPVYTTGYTATLQAVGMLGEYWAGRTSDWSALPALVATMLSRLGAVVDEMGAAFDEACIIDVVASGASGATAGEGALLLREAARAHTAAHETYNYLHGPMEPMETGSAAIVVGDDREVRLASDLASFGCSTVLLTGRPDVEPRENLTVIPLPEAPSALARAALEILPVQLLGWNLARRRGLAVDGFRYKQDDIKLAAR